MYIFLAQNKFAEPVWQLPQLSKKHAFGKGMKIEALPTGSF